MRKLKDVNKKIEETVVGGYKKVEDAVVGGYKKVEDKFVNAGFKFVSARHGALWRVDVRWD